MSFVAKFNQIRVFLFTYFHIRSTNLYVIRIQEKAIAIANIFITVEDKPIKARTPEYIPNVIRANIKVNIILFIISLLNHLHNTHY